MVQYGHVKRRTKHKKIKYFTINDACVVCLVSKNVPFLSYLLYTREKFIGTYYFSGF